LGACNPAPPRILRNTRNRTIAPVLHYIVLPGFALAVMYWRRRQRRTLITFRSLKLKVATMDM